MISSTATKKMTINHAYSNVGGELFTIGYEGKTIAEYLETLQRSGVRVLIDVRKNPISRKKGFSKTALSIALTSSGIKYIHLPELGIDSDYRKDLSSPESYNRLFAFYEKVLLPKADESMQQLRAIIGMYGSAALTCFERDAHFCHRHCVADRCVDLGIVNGDVTHL